MKIIIAGAGKIGFSVAQILAAEGHDITVIDRDPNRIYETSNSLDVICVEGSGTNPETLIEAGAAEADLLVAATRDDEINMVCGISAKSLGTKQVIARIRDTDYLRQTDFLRRALGLSYIINPEYECAKEISRMLRFPGANRVCAFSAGSLEMAEHRVAAGSRLDGMCLKDLPASFGAKVLVSMVQRGDEAIIPNGRFVLRADDLLEVAGDNAQLRKFFASAGMLGDPVKNVMLMGGGRIAVYLAQLLMENGMSVSIMENDRARCDELCDSVPGARVICGDGTKGEVLLEEGLRNTDAFVALTGDDGSNIVTSMYAKNCAVGKIVVKVNREYYSDILHTAGLDSLVTPKALVAQQLARYVRAMSNSQGSSMETLYRLAEGQVEALEFVVNENSRCVGLPLKLLRIRPNVLIAALVRNGATIIPNGETVISPGDHAVIIAKAGWLKNMDDVIDEVGV